MAVAETDAGHVLVLDQMLNRVLVFSASSGQFIHAFGGGGSGPGEFQHPSYIGVVGDRTWVYDQMLRRLVVFRKDGSHLETTSQRVPLQNAVEPDVVARALFSDGTYLGASLPLVGLIPDDESATYPLLRISAAGEVLNPIAELSFRDVFMRFRGGGSVFTQPFLDNPLWDIGPDGQQVVIVDRPFPESRDASFRLLRISLHGDTVLDQSYSISARPLEPIYIEHVIDSLQSYVAHPNPEAVDEIRRGLEEQVIRPRFFSPVSRLLLGKDGTIWLRREFDPRSSEDDYEVLSTSGDRVGTITLPREWSVRAVAHDHVWVVIEDEFDIPSLFRFEVRRSEPM